ncbi:hypothetical protein ACFVUS_20145 [Nocardia sp. NPDC058058]
MTPTSAERATLARVLGMLAAGVLVRPQDSQWNLRGHVCGQRGTGS